MTDLDFLDNEGLNLKGRGARVLSRQSGRATAKVRGDGNESSEKTESPLDLKSPIVWFEGGEETSAACYCRK